MPQKQDVEAPCEVGYLMEVHSAAYQVLELVVSEHVDFVLTWVVVLVVVVVVVVADSKTFPSFSVASALDAFVVAAEVDS
jgi:uncharacterized membrane protein YczE